MIHPNETSVWLKWLVEYFSVSFMIKKSTHTRALAQQLSLRNYFSAHLSHTQSGKNLFFDTVRTTNLCTSKKKSPIRASLSDYACVVFFIYFGVEIFRHIEKVFFFFFFEMTHDVCYPCVLLFLYVVLFHFISNSSFFSMTAKEDLVESHLTNGQQQQQQQQQQSNSSDPVDLPDEQQAPPPDYQTSVQNENEDEDNDDDNGRTIEMNFVLSLDVFLF